MIEVEGPDGSIFEFPDGMSPQEMKAAMAKRYPKPAPEHWNFTSQVASKLPFSDEVAGIAKAAGGELAELTHGREPKSFWERYTEGKAEYQADADAYARDNPRWNALAFAAGLPVLGPGKTKVAATFNGRAWQGIKDGAKIGALYGASEGDGVLERGKNALFGTAAGAVTGGAASLLGEGANRLYHMAVRKPAAQREFVRNAPDTDDLKDMANAAYDAADAHGLRLRPDSFGSWLRGTEKKLIEEGADRHLHPRLATLGNKLTKMAGGQEAMSSPQTVRRLINNVADSSDQSEARLGRLMRSAYDDYLQKLAPDDVMAGNASGYIDDLAQANRLWGRMKKSEILDQAFEAAQNQGSGFENGLRIQFRRILNKGDLRRKFSPDEIEVMQQVVRGTTVSNILKKVGKFGAGEGQQSNALLHYLGIIGGAQYGGPLGAVVPSVVGNMAQKASEGATRKSADLAAAMARTGEKAPIPVYLRNRLLEMGTQRAAVPEAVDQANRLYPYAQGRQP